ncbi:MAG TPA: NAD-dependent epimerase/dehydratase family protein [Desulfomonilaceae bacterium]|nr:NAD-dependent epimerase/dehydratase family protein [Desulfomonilaceae bacterium]
MKLAITGATGFLGRHFLAHLARDLDVQIFCVTRNLSSIQEMAYGDIHWLKGDLCSIPFCREVVAGMDVILHLAHSSHPLTSELDLAGDIVSSVLPSTTLLQAVVEAANRPHIVFASSGGAIYGESLPGRPFTEDAPCLPMSGYGIQKLMIEHYVRMLASRGYLTASVLRITNAYGTLLPINRRQGLIGVAMARMLRNLPIPVYGSMSNVRDYIHLDDIFTCLKIALFRRNEFEIFNVGAGKGTSVSEVFALLEQVTGLHPIIEHDPRAGSGGLVKCCVVSPEKAAKELNWRPGIDLRRGIAKMFQEFRDRRISD